MSGRALDWGAVALAVCQVGATMDNGWRLPVDGALDLMTMPSNFPLAEGGSLALPFTSFRASADLVLLAFFRACVSASRLCPPRGATSTLFSLTFALKVAGGSSAGGNDGLRSGYEWTFGWGFRAGGWTGCSVLVVG